MAYDNSGVVVGGFDSVRFFIHLMGEFRVGGLSG